MILRQFFEASSSTYTYLIASGGEALIIDPVKEQCHGYATLLRELDVRLLHALDTHTHADHITGLGDLSDATGCVTVMGEHTKADCVLRRIEDGEVLCVGDITLQGMYTPGHTDESFSFVLNPSRPRAVFTGDVLLIRGTGRTDFQGGDPRRSWDSIVNKLFHLPDDTIVYPAHDYRGFTASTIGEEKRFNPRLAGKSEADYVAIMNGLNLPEPKMMRTAVPANLACGRS
jgi:glyoxylase-like metal-dependent hydrolase (beta-lactamase superfamily II)